MFSGRVFLKLIVLVIVVPQKIIVMKKNFYTFFLLVSFLSLFFWSCQKEESVLIDENTEETINVNSPLARLLLNTSQNAGIVDDIIDGNSCCSIEYPVDIIVNGQELTIMSEDDLQLIQDIYDLFPNDIDTLEIIFPITCIYEDYSSYYLRNQSELQAIIDACTGSQEITCVDLVYPITFFTFDSSQQQTDSVIIGNDVELYLFLQGLDSSDIISIDFPISMVLSDGTVQQINNNEELTTAITTCVNDPGTDPIDPALFEQDLTTGVWYVTYFFDDYDETNSFNGNEFSFALDHTAQAVNGGTTTNGTWNFIDGSTPKLDLFFGLVSPYDELDEDWEILEATTDIIRLKHISGSNGSVDLITFGRIPNSGGSNEEVNIFIENLTTGVWYVNLFNDGEDKTCDYVDYVFTYTTDGMVVAVSPANTINGFWTVEDIGGGVLDFVLNFDNSGPGSILGDLNDNWNVIENNQIIIRLDDPIGGGGTDLLTFGRNPADCGGGGGGTPNPQVLRDIMVQGSWYIATFLDDGDDETIDYNGYGFNFYANENVNAYNGSQYVYGIWIVSLVNDELNFEFDMDSPINGADNDEYKVLQFSETSVTFITRDSNENIEDTLVFEKN
jgi:hypothetical protein